MAKGIATRKDFDPTEYESVGYFYKGDSSSAMAEAYNDDYIELVELLGEDVAYGMVSANTGCDSCGTQFLHGTVVRHTPTGELFAIGQTCGREYFALGSVQDFKRAEAEKAAKRAAIKASAAGLLATTDGLEEALEADHYISEDLKRKLWEYGSLSERQIELAFKLHHQKLEQAKKDEELNLVPVVEGPGQTLEGIVLSTKVVTSVYGDSLKMLVLVEAENGAYKLWGTVPQSISGVEKGTKVRFTANVEVSLDDESFGFFSRPRKAEAL